MSTAIQHRDNAKAARFNNVRRLLESEGVMTQVQKALPRFITPERMMRVAVSALQKTPRLLECTDGSLIAAIVQSAELGLEVNSPLGYAWIIPYGTQATLQIGYRGFIALAHRSGKVANLVGEVVYEKDKLAIELGTQRRLVHVPYMKGDRGKMIGAYATVLYKDGGTDFEYMSADEIGAIKSRSQGAKKADSPWNTSDEPEMWRKTPVRRLAKRLPMTAEDTSLLKAAIVDEENEYRAAKNVTPVAQIEGPDKITEAQRVELVTKSRELGVDLTEIVNSFGFELLADITTDAYDSVLEAIKAPIEPDVVAEAANTITVEPEPVDPIESQIADLKEAVVTIVNERHGGDFKKALKNRVLGDLTVEELRDALVELSAA